MLHDTLEHFFKPEVRKQGSDYFDEGAVFLSATGDTGISAFVRSGSTSNRVSFLAASIASTTFTVNCSCSSSQRGQLCKHIWAVLLKVEEAYPDFLDSKTEIEKGDVAVTKKPEAPPTPAQLEREAAQKARAESMKERQGEYRREQYQKMKARAKERKGGGKSSGKSSSKSSLAPEVPEKIQAAMEFFSVNGFPMEMPLNPQTIQQAKKILSRVFHPDKGGTHEEILELNRNVDLLLDFAGA